MHTPRWTRSGLGLALAALLATIGTVAFTEPGAGAPAADSGVLCSTDPSSTFDLTATTGSVSIPDGNTIFMWSYALGSGPSATFQLPGPTLCVTQGDIVTVVLHNTLPEPASIIFPGQDDVEADGVPSQPVLSGATITSLTQPAAPNGTVTYRFVANEPGTYYYESGTDQAKQVQMGLYGALIVRPLNHPDWAYTSSTKFNPNTEYMFLLSEVDPDLHQAVERGLAYNAAATHPRYWMINGRSFPDTIAPNGAPWLPDQPYSGLVHIQPKTTTNPDPALFRYINVGSLHHPMHPHGNHGRVIARDGRLLDDAGQDLSYEKFLVLVGAGQTWDTTFDWTDRELWTPTGNPIPVTVPQLGNLTFKSDATWYSGSPYLGHQDELPTGVTSFNQCGEYYHVSHSHALNEAANFEAGFGGMLTLIRIDPPGGC